MSIRSLAAVCVLAVVSSVASAQGTKSPLRFVPAEAEWVVKVDRPRELVNTVETNPLFIDAQKLAGIREYYDTTTFQQLYQRIAYFEKRLGKTRDELLDDLGAGGLVIAAKLTNPGGAILVLQAKDEVRLRRFVDLALEAIGQELERQESKDRIVRKKYQELDVGQIGPKLSFALVDAALIVASEEKVLKRSLDDYLAKKNIQQNVSFAEAHKKAPAKALLWTWMNFEELRKNDNFNNGLKAVSLDPLQMILFGGLTDLLKRTPYGTAAVTRDESDFRLSLDAPRGSAGMSLLSQVILPPAGAGTLPLLAPPRVLSSSSYYLDLGKLWDKRVEILGEKNAKGLDEADKNLNMLSGIKLSTILQSMGPRQRVVVAQQKEQPYKKVRPGQPIPAFALVVEMRDPSFAKDMDAILRTGAIAATFFVGLQLSEETYKDCEIVSYYFSETKKVESDAQNVRFNFSPSFVAVGDQFVMSATAELARELVDAIKAEKKRPPSKASMQTQLHAAGLVDLIRANEDATLTQLILNQALPPKAAKTELGAIVAWIERLGVLRIESTYGANDFRYDILWQAKKK